MSLNGTLKRHIVIRDPKTSENLAYGCVNFEASTSGEDIETLIIETQEGSVGEDLPHPAYEAVNYNQLVD